MIELKIDGEFVDLAPNAKVNVRINNPLFTDGDVIPGDYSLPFDLASPEMSGKNAAIFGNNDVPESTDAFKRKPAELRFDGVLFKKGEVINREAGQVNMRFGMATIAENFKALKLRDLMDENIVIDNSTSVAKAVYIKPGTRLYFTGDNPITINGRDYDGATLADLVSAINADVTTPRATATLFASGSTPGGLPAPYIKIVSTAAAGDPHALLSVKEKEANLDFADGYIWLVEAELPGYYAMFNTFFSSYMGATPATNKFRIPAGNNEFYRQLGSRIPTPDYRNLSNSGTLVDNVPANYLEQFLCNNRNNLQPLVMLRYIFEKAATALGIGYEGDWVGQTDYNAFLIHNTKPLGFYQDFVGDTAFLFWKREFNLKDLVPDITFVDLLKGLQSRLNLKIAYNEATNKISIKRRKVIAESTQKRNLENAGVSKPPSDESLTGIRMEAEKIDDKIQQPDYYNVGDPELTWKTICGEIPAGGIFRYFDEDNAKFPLRLITYGGIGNINDGAVILTAAPLAIGGRTLATLYNDEWKRFAQQRIDRKVIEVPLYWGMAELLAVNLDEKVRYNSNDYFFAWLDVEFLMTKINAKATLYKA